MSKKGQKAFDGICVPSSNNWKCITAVQAKDILLQVFVD